MCRVLITKTIHSWELKLLEMESEIQFFPDLLYENVLKIIEPLNCILSRSESPITRELMEHAPNMKINVWAAVGIENINFDYATQLGILVYQHSGGRTPTPLPN